MSYGPSEDPMPLSLALGSTSLRNLSAHLSLLNLSALLNACCCCCACRRRRQVGRIEEMAYKINGLSASAF